MGIALRLVYLDADPDYYAWIGYVTDEGRWVKRARDLVLFGHVIGPEESLHVYLAPLFHLTHTLVFKLFGVGFLTARLLTAVSGCALLVVAWIFLRRVATGPALMLALMLLAFEVDLVAMSRVAIPEMPAMLFELTAFAVIVTPPAGATRMMLAGFLLLLAVGTKATVLPVVLIFAALVVQLSRDGARQRSRNLLMFGAGLCGPVVPIALVWAVGRVSIQPLRDTVDVVGGFVEFASLYNAASMPFESTLAPLFNVWGMVACLVFIGWIASPRNAKSSTVHHCYTASLFWLVAYSLVMMSLAYFPDRYRIHLLLPLAVNVAAGLTLLQQAGLTEVTRSLGRMNLARRLVTLTVFGLPSAAIWAPLLASAYQLTGGDAAHLRVRAVSVAAALVVTLVVLDRRLRRGQSLLPFIVFPIVAVLAWLTYDRLGFEGLPFWPTPERGPWTWMLGMGWLALLAAWVLTLRLVPWRTRMLPVAAAAYAMLSLVRILPAYITPQYTMRQASESLGRDLAQFEGVITTGRAEGLFTANTLRYRNVWLPGEPNPDALVVAFAPLPPTLQAEYRLVTQYDVAVSSSYVPPPGLTPRLTRSQLPVRLYVRQ